MLQYNFVCLKFCSISYNCVKKTLKLYVKDYFTSDSSFKKSHISIWSYKTFVQYANVNLTKCMLCIILIFQ